MAEQATIAVVGGGIAGLVAAREAASAGATVWHIMGQDVMGGLVANVGALENFSGGDVAGIDLATTLFTDASELGVVPLMEDASHIIQEGDEFVVAAGGEQVRASRVILATGARLRRLDVRGASEFEDLGLSYCGWCDGPLHKDKSVVVIGGGDAAYQEALHLATIARRVTVLVRGDRPKARPDLIERVRDSANIEVRPGIDVLEVQGEVSVSGVKIRDRAAAAETVLACSGVFPFIGLEPASQCGPAGLAVDAAGAVLTRDRCQASIPGFYAVGAVRSGYSGRLDDAIEEARQAVATALGLA